MQPSKEQIENAARLVLETDNAWSRARGIPMVLGRQVEEGGAHVIREWQPWADTEAGQSDWAVLDTAVRLWLIQNQDYVVDSDDLIVVEMRLADADESGDLTQRQAATFAAAAAIGANFPEGNAIKGVEG